MAQAFKPIVGQPSLSEIAYREIRSAIVQGRVQSGERLVYRTLAEKFGISPTPVRDAIQRLVSEGALALDERGVAHVPVIDAKTYSEIINLRVQLEGYAAAEVAKKAATDPSIVDKLATIHERLAQHKADGNIDAALYENEQFHSQFIKAADMPILEEIVRSLWMRCGPSLRLLYDPGYQPLEIHPHVVMLEALRKGDATAAQAAVEHDLRYAGEHIRRRIEALNSDT
ncbi:GntR family transcriptional regulator [Bordetella sp. 02P26C-1]|uniref:GntR family transcriptional regulator n=1 Tax=Bordetella sp. 02P26C-1 TaxID=2683195 RepID=UPI0013553DD2|nr:GntR family transcriptional regulator [Bordetella sp. 02P26C-1]MVW77570.1 FCD domain-containing protein [Bordetella sp. 02P26C-1]